MADHQCPAAKGQRIRAGDRAVRSVGELKIPHSVQPNYANPIGHQRIFAAFGSERSPVGMSNDLCSEPAKHDRPEVVIGMMVRQDQPPNWLRRDPPDRLDQLLALLGTGEGVDDYDAFTGDNEAGVGATLGSPAGVSDCRIDIGCETADRGWVRLRGGRCREEPGQYDDRDG